MSEAGLKFDPKAFAETADRIRQGKDYGQDNPRPAFDPKLRKDVVDDAKRGRKIEDYKPVLEKLGFRYLTARQRGPFGNGMPRTEGEWVFRSGNVRCAMTSDEICAHFPGGPQELFEWIEQWKFEERAKASGLILPRR